MMMWTTGAEQFYQKRIDRMRDKLVKEENALKSSGDWAKELKLGDSIRVNKEIEKMSGRYLGHESIYD